MANEKTAKKKNLAPKKLQLLVTIVNRKKAEFYADFLQEFEVNMQLSFAGLSDSEKSVIFSIIKEEKSQAALKALEEKFTSIKNGKGIAFTVPMTGVIGVAIYQFLSNLPANN